MPEVVTKPVDLRGSQPKRICPFCGGTKVVTVRDPHTPDGMGKKQLDCPNCVPGGSSRVPMQTK